MEVFPEPGKAHPWDSMLGPGRCLAGVSSLPVKLPWQDTGPSHSHNHRCALWPFQGVLASTGLPQPLVPKTCFSQSSCPSSQERVHPWVMESGTCALGSQRPLWLLLGAEQEVQALGEARGCPPVLWVEPCLAVQEEAREAVCIGREQERCEVRVWERGKGQWPGQAASDSALS